MPDTIKKVGIPVILLILGLAIGRYAAPTKVEKVEIEKVVDRIVEKKVYVKVKTETKEKKKTTTTIIKKDGTKIVKEVEEEKNATKTSEEDSKDRSSESITESTKSIKIHRKKAQFKVSAMIAHLENNEPGYGMSMEARISGPFFAGVWGLKDSVLKKDYYGLSVGMEFWKKLLEYQAGRGREKTLSPRWLKTTMLKPGFFR